MGFSHLVILVPSNFGLTSIFFLCVFISPVTFSDTLIFLQLNPHLKMNYVNNMSIEHGVSILFSYTPPPKPIEIMFRLFLFRLACQRSFFPKKRTAEMTRKQEDPSLYTWSRIERVTIMDGHRNATARPPRLWHPTHIRHNKSIYDIYDASSSYKVVHLFIFSQNRTAQQGRPIRM